MHPGSFIEMAPTVITEFGLPIRYVDAVRRQPDGPPWWISGHALHDQSPAVAEHLLDQLISAEPEPGFFAQGRAGWQAFTTFLLASTTNPASLGGTSGWGIGIATPHSIAVSLSNGGLLTAGARDAHEELATALKTWHDLGEPGHTDLMPTFTSHDDGWTVRPQLRSRV